MATIQEILDKINASKSNNVNNNSFIDLMRQISGNPEDAVAPVNDTNSIYGHIVQMYTTLYDGGIDYAVLADEVDMLQGVYDNLIAINSVHVDKTKLDSIYADKIKLDQLFADKAVIDRVYGSITNIDRVHTSIDKLDTVYASVLKMDTVADNIADVNTVADNIAVLNEIYDNRVEIYAADNNATVATTKAIEASNSASTALGYKNDVSAMKLAIETIYDTFDDRFLGTKTVDPVLDNDGDALIDGAMYFNTSSNAMKVYDVGTTTWYAIPQIYLNALLDVELTSISTGDTLIWNGTKWANHTLTKADVGLNLADNTSDATKNVLSATKLTTARTINGVSFNGTANITTYDSTKVAKVASTDNAIVRFNGTAGEVQGSGVTINDANEIIGATNLGTAASKNVGLESGNVMEVGAFGLGFSNTYIVDANALTATGFYTTGSEWVGSLEIGISGNNQGYLCHQRWANTPYAKQTFFNVNSTWQTWTRRKDLNVWSAWVKDFNQLNILGTVSQSGGVPTGAIIESGSNANGSYTKFANGSMMEYKYIICASIANVKYSETITWPISGAVFGTGATVVAMSFTESYTMTQPPGFNTYLFFFTSNTTQSYHFVLTKYTP